MRFGVLKPESFVSYHNTKLLELITATEPWKGRSVNSIRKFPGLRHGFPSCSISHSFPSSYFWEQRQWQCCHLATVTRKSGQFIKLQFIYIAILRKNRPFLAELVKWRTAEMKMCGSKVRNCVNGISFHDFFFFTFFFFFAFFNASIIMLRRLWCI